MIVPICIGMPRSASRMTWQLVKQLSPPEPDWWQDRMSIDAPGARVENTRDSPWPHRSHNYVSGNDPVIYTYRNPVEAYLSFLSRVSPVIVWRPDRTAVNEILQHVLTQRKLRMDRGAARNILWLRYEDYFGDDRRRLDTIMEFMGVTRSAAEQERILEYVSLSTNRARSKDIPSNIDDAIAFHKCENTTTGIQGHHINEATQGRVGAYINNYPDEVSRIRSARPNEPLGELRLFAESLGYAV